MCLPNFNRFQNNSFRGCYNHLVNNKFGRVTISYGFYNRANANSTINGYINIINQCAFNFPFGEGWYFGVNLRIKCEQAGALNKNNINLAANISQHFCQYTIPKYVNNHYDQGVDFFTIPILKCKSIKSCIDLFDGKMPDDIEVVNIFNENQVEIAEVDILATDNIMDWIDAKITLFADLYNQSAQ